MKKIIWILILAILYFQKFDYVDLSQYQSKTIQVEIKGEVNHPNVYTLPVRSNIKSLIKKAKGLKEGADISSLNLNEVLLNKDVIVIEKQRKEVKISINSAPLEALMDLPGIGEAMANRIIVYRRERRFQSLEDIMQVKGIKAKLFAKIKDRICL